MAAGNNSGLLIAALVAIVAVVGLVILFRGGSSGAVVTNPSAVCEGYWTYVYSANDGGGWICTDTRENPVGGSFRQSEAEFGYFEEGREVRKRQPSGGFTDTSLEWFERRSGI